MAGNNSVNTNRLELLITTSGTYSVGATYSATYSVATCITYTEPSTRSTGYIVSNLITSYYSAVVTINGISTTWIIPPIGVNPYYNLYEFIINNSAYSALGLFGSYNGNSFEIAGLHANLSGMTIINTQVLTSYSNQDLQSSYYLDTYGDDNISFELLVQNVNDLSSSNSSYSYNFKLPGTKNNRQLMGFMENINSLSNSPNPNLSLPITVLIDSNPILKGSLYVTDILVNVDTNQIDYNVVIISGLMNLIQTVGDNYLTDLNWNGYNHIYNITSITQSWNNSWAQGYVYPLIDNGYNWTLGDITAGKIGTTSSGTVSIYNNGIPVTSTVSNINMFAPATYVKTIINNIISSAGYQYTSNFFNTPQFESLIIPYNNGDLQQNATFSQYHSFQAGMTQSVTINNIISYDSKQFVAAINNNYTAPNFDTGGFWNTGSYSYVNNTGTLFGQQFTANVSLHPNISFFEFQVGFWRSGGTSVGYIPLMNNLNYYTLTTSAYAAPATYSLNFTTILLNGTGLSAPIQPGESVQLVITATNISAFSLYDGSFTYIASVFNTPSNLITQNMTINYKYMLPNQIKQKDFLLSIIKMFNLYIEPDKNNPYLLNIEPRDPYTLNGQSYEGYYGSGNIIDWSGKINIDTPVDEQILSTTQNKTTLLTYTKDSDYYNNIYENQYNQIWGQYKYIINSNFIQGQQNWSVIFSPTPLVAVPDTGSAYSTLSDVVIPKIAKLNNNTLERTSFNIRILYFNKINPPSGAQLVVNGLDINNNFKVGTFSFYPYAGNFDNPYTQSFDLNFGQCIGQFNGLTSITDNNIFNTFWLNNMNEFSDPNARLITVEAYLTPEDISNFKFNDNIFINLNEQGAQYFKVSRIYNYDPSRTVTCSIDLIKTYQIAVTPRSVVNNDPSLGQSNKHITGYLQTSTNNNIYSGHAIVIGPGNQTWNQYTHVVGAGNITGGERNNVFGHFNSIGSDSHNNFVIGSNVQVEPNLKNNVVIGSPSPVRVTGQIMMATTPVGYINDLDAGSDDILNPFPPTTPINVINSGVDILRNIGSQTLIQTFDGGTDFVL